jgi:hypothetical protein
MSTRSKPLTQQEIRSAMDAAGVKAVLTLEELSEVSRVKVKTLYEWIAKGRLDGTFRRRGKPYLFWRDRVITELFNGKEWND